jgi:DNA-directed RNA polymerase specialized sigma subunit
VANDKKSVELDIYHQWKSTQDPQHFQKLYGSMSNLIYDAARKASYGSNLPESAHRIWAAQNFYDALRTYNPNAGVALQTHVYNAVHQKGKRLNYQYQNLGHMPEPRAMKVGLYQTEVENLKDRLGREPSASEVADHLGWGIRDVTSIQKEIHKDLAMSGGLEEQPFFESSTDEEILDYIYFELTPEEQVVYDYIFGRHGKPRLRKATGKVDYEAIGSRSGFSASKARGLAGKVIAKVVAARKR